MRATAEMSMSPMAALEKQKTVLVTNSDTNSDADDPIA